MDTRNHESFFCGYAQNVDRAREQGFWRLSDSLILEIIRKILPPDAVQGGVILDAGGGTGRWIVELGREYDATFFLYDLSRAMLEKARENMLQANMGDRVVIFNGDLCSMDVLLENSVNHAISLYSPLSFIDTPHLAIAELYRVIKPGGRLVLMVQGYYNAIASKINNFRAPSDELLKLEQTEVVAWTPNVPTLRVFSEERIKQLLMEAGFGIVGMYGVPVFTQPGAEDFDPQNRLRSPISQALEDETFFRAVVRVEMKHNSRPGMANRGVNLVAVVEK